GPSSANVALASQQIQQQQPPGALLSPTPFHRPPQPSLAPTRAPRPPPFGQAPPIAPPPSAAQSSVYPSPASSQFPRPMQPQLPRPMLSQYASSSSATPGPSGLGCGYGQAPANYGGELGIGNSVKIFLLLSPSLLPSFSLSSSLSLSSECG
ncbi:MAG: hypothetical protein MJE68_19980, partial [Proteobacteria bacterium]|nr:hypothetical protein [Pseudomonadota bacterium]